MRFPKLVLPFALCVFGALPVAAQEQPTGFEQVLPRGRIAAINRPTYVSADEDQIPDTAWVLGFAIGGSAYAYSLNLLNTHEVVNDEADGQPFAAVW